MPETEDYEYEPKCGKQERTEVKQEIECARHATSERGFELAEERCENGEANRQCDQPSTP